MIKLKEIERVDYVQFKISKDGRYFFDNVNETNIFYETSTNQEIVRYKTKCLVAAYFVSDTLCVIIDRFSLWEMDLEAMEYKKILNKVAPSNITEGIEINDEEILFATYDIRKEKKMSQFMIYNHMTKKQRFIDIDDGYFPTLFCKDKKIFVLNKIWGSGRETSKLIQFHDENNIEVLRDFDELKEDIIVVKLSKKNQCYYVLGLKGFRVMDEDLTKTLFEYKHKADHVQHRMLLSEDEEMLIFELFEPVNWETFPADDRSTYFFDTEKMEILGSLKEVNITGIDSKNKTVEVVEKKGRKYQTVIYQYEIV